VFTTRPACIMVLISPNSNAIIIEDPSEKPTPRMSTTLFFRTITNRPRLSPANTTLIR
jgi:hypothetical protein